MPRVNFRDVGNWGVVRDVPGHELPPEVWSEANNVVMKDGYISPIRGETVVEGETQIVPHYLFSSPSGTQPFWVYTDLDKVYAVVAGTHTNITNAGGDYTGGIDDRWNGGWLNGIMVLNNGVDVPQVWNPISAGQALVDLPNWPANTLAKVIRPHRNFLIALDVTKSSVNYPTLVKWSDLTDPGTVPGSWDESDPTNLAGEFGLSDTSGKAIDGRALGDSFMVYKEDAIYRLDRIATNAVFKETPISLRTGIMAQECAQEFRPGRHIVLTRDADIVITDGQGVEGIADRRVLRQIEQSINPNYRERSFIVVDYVRKEAWIVFPRTNSQYCNTAWVWNFQDNTWSRRDISPTLDIKSGVYDQTAVTDAWSAETNSWATVNRAWGERLFVQGSYRLLGAMIQDDAIHEMNRGTTQAGGEILSVVERRGLAVVGQDRFGQYRMDPNRVKFISELYPLITAPIGTEVKVRVGAQDNPNSPMTWGDEFSFDPRTMEKVCPDVEGKYIAVRFTSNAQHEWKLHGYALQVDIVGEYD